MKSYPSIDRNLRKDIYVYAFDKLDGSNIRAEWNSKRGFYKFGTRTQLMDEKSQPFGKAIPILRAKFEEQLGLIFNDMGWKDAICFFEYYGPSSCFGGHSEDEEKTLTLIDINPYKQGILNPDQFIKLFHYLDIPRVLFEGFITEEFVDQVKAGTLPGMTLEGVVCKGLNDKATKMPIMFKIKSRPWLDKLKKYCGGNEALYNKLV